MSVRLISALRRFGAAREGLAAVEFALILPMMCLLLLGSVEITSFLQANRRLENASSSLADVMSRDTIVTNDEMTGMWAALEPLMYPNSGDAVDVRITSIQITSDTEAHVVWSEIRGTTYSQLEADDPVTTLSANMMVEGTSIIRVEAAMNYQPPIGFFFLDNANRLGRDQTSKALSHIAYRRSRLADPIERDDD